MTTTIGESEQARVPVTLGGIPVRNLWHILLYAWSEVPPEATRRRCQADIEAAPTLDALLAEILAKLMQQRLRIGLGRSYVAERQMRRGIRGRVDLTESVKRNAFENGHAYCRFEEFSANSPKNQIIRSTLLRLAQSGHFGRETQHAEELRKRLRRLVRDLDNVDLIELTPTLVRRRQVGREDDDYRLMLALCELILQRLMPTETAGHKMLPGLDRDALTLYRIYERFVANFYRARLYDWTVTSPAPLDWHATKASHFLPGMVADLILTHRRSGQIIILDTKCTPHVLIEGRFGNMVFDSSHLYQLYAYLRSQERKSEMHARATGVLLYPTVRYQLSEGVDLQGHSMRVETIDLSLSWTEVEEHLLTIVASIYA